MVDASIYYRKVVVAVVDGVSQQQNVIRNSMRPQVIETVVCAQLLHVHLAVCHDVAHQIDVAQVAYYVQLTPAPCLYVVHETAAEAFQEFHVGALRLDTQVYVVAFRRYIAVNERLMFRSVISHCLDVYLALFLVEVYVGMEHAQWTLLKFKVLYVKLRIGIRVVEDALHDGLS